MTDTAKQLSTLLSDQPANPMRPNQVAEFEEERDRLQSIVRAPAWQTGADRGAAQKRFRAIDKMLAEQAPKPLDGARQDKVATLTKDLQADIQESLLPQSTMRRNPAGAVDFFRRREGSKPVKDKILLWKRALRALDPSNTDQDYTNIERIRPAGLHADGTTTFMADAQIPGKFAQTPLAKQNWPLGEPTVDTPLKQAQRVERKLTPEQLQAARDRIAYARAKKAEKAATQSSPAHDVPAAGATES